MVYANSSASILNKNALKSTKSLSGYLKKNCHYLFSLDHLVSCLAEGEAEAEWLQDAGLSDLLGDRSSENDNIVLLSTLTKTQAAAVQRRLDTYSRSRRRKNKHPVRDVRDIFGVVSSEVCWFRGASCKASWRCGS